MATIKNKSIKLGSDLNYTEGVKVQAGEDISTGDLIIILGHTGGMGIAFKADSTTTLRAASGRMLIAKHAIPSGGFGVGLPWQIVSFDTSTMTLGDPIYLNAAGAFSNGTVLNSVVRRQVGTVITVGTDGRVLISPESFSAEASDYQVTGGDVKLIYLAGGGQATLNSNLEIVDAWVIKNSTTGGAGAQLEITVGASVIETFSLSGVNPTEIVRANSLDNTLVGSGNSIDAVISGTDPESTVYMLCRLF